MGASPQYPKFPELWAFSETGYTCQPVPVGEKLTLIPPDTPPKDITEVSAPGTHPRVRHRVVFPVRPPVYLCLFQNLTGAPITPNITGTNLSPLPPIRVHKRNTYR